MAIPLSADEKAELVLGGPLGREFLFEFLGDPLLEMFEALGLGKVPGRSRAWRLGSRRPPEPEKRYERWQEVPQDEVRAFIQSRVRRRDWQSAGRLDQQALLMKLAQVSSSFGFSGGDDALWGLTSIARDELRPLAEALVNSAATGHWWDEVRRDDQRLLEWDEGPRLVGSDLESAVAQCMEQERADHQERLSSGRWPIGARNVGAYWWSAPSFAQNSWTTGAVEDLPSIALGDFIDTYRPHGEADGTVWKLEISAEARVLEISRPDDWDQLVRRYPRDVTGTHDGEWRRWGDVDGPWYLPDWEQVTEEFDGVHVTVGGYLASCGKALPVEDGYTVLSGWIPDATVWVRDVSISRQRLGRWSGRPLDVRSWSDVMEHWHPS